MVAGHARHPLFQTRSTTMKDAASTPFTLPAFQAALQTRFQVRLDAETAVDLLLVEARATQPGTDAQGARHFALLFQGARAPLLPQRLYRFEHDTMGAFDLFIVPVAQSQEHYEYEAVFNLALGQN